MRGRRQFQLQAVLARSCSICTPSKEDASKASIYSTCFLRLMFDADLANRRRCTLDFDHTNIAMRQSDLPGTLLRRLGCDDNESQDYHKNRLGVFCAF